MITCYPHESEWQYNYSNLFFHIFHLLDSYQGITFDEAGKIAFMVQKAFEQAKIEVLGD